MTAKSWVAGKGHVKGSELPSGTRKAIDAKLKEKGAERIGSVLAGATAPATGGPGPLERVAARLKAAVRGLAVGDSVSLGLPDVASTTGVSLTFLRSSEGRLNLIGEAQGWEIAISGPEVLVRARVSSVAAASPKEAPGEAAADEPVAAPRVRAAKASKAETPAEVDRDYFAFDRIVVLKIKAAIKLGKNIWLSGPTGCGKSEYLTRTLEDLGIHGAPKVSFHGESSVDDLLGHYTLRDGKTEWIEGALPRAMKAGLPLVCEEIDAAPAEANLAMQRALEVRHGKARAFHNARNGEDVVAAPGFCVLATANSAGGGDHTGLYAGVQVQNAAFRNRFMFERVGYPQAEVEAEILIRRTGVDRPFAAKAVQFATAAREAVTRGDLYTPVSTRSLLEFASLISAFREGGMAVGEAIREAMLSAVIYQASSESDAKALEGFVQRVFGGS